jgi:hypothetical protein
MYFFRNENWISEYYLDELEAEILKDLATTLPSIFFIPTYRTETARVSPWVCGPQFSCRYSVKGQFNLSGVALCDTHGENDSTVFHASRSQLRYNSLNCIPILEEAPRFSGLARRNRTSGLRGAVIYRGMNSVTHVMLV